MKKCGTECAQVILLSHDPFFLHEVYSKLPKTNDRCSLELFREQRETSNIRCWDPERATESTYSADHAALVLYLEEDTEHANLINIARKIRPVLEGYLHDQFPHAFAHKDMLGTMINKISKLPDPPTCSVIEDLRNIVAFANQYHHSSDRTDDVSIDPSELRTYVEHTLTIIESDGIKNS